MSSPDLSQDPRWVAVLNRDAALASQFVYGVTSTRIFCRSGCPAPTPHPSRVRFFEDANSAQVAGFRPCRRCRPERGQRRQTALERARELLERSPNGLSMEALAGRVGLSPSHLQRTFTQEIGISPAEYSRAMRMKRARSSLATGTQVTDALYQAGFGSSRAFYEVAPGALGMTPSQFRKGGEGVEIRYSVSRSFLGHLLLGATARGVCAVKMGENPADLVAQLVAEFPQAQLTRDEGGLEEIRSVVLTLASGRPGGRELPLDVRGTVFQWLVWREIQAIPRGRTRTYGELAAGMGRPGAARAVARACASNQVALVIPCHRVVPAAGGEGGYRWGAERKRRLLEAEAGGD